ICFRRDEAKPTPQPLTKALVGATGRADATGRRPRAGSTVTVHPSDDGIRHDQRPQEARQGRDPRPGQRSGIEPPEAGRVCADDAEEADPEGEPKGDDGRDAVHDDLLAATSLYPANGMGPSCVPAEKWLASWNNSVSLPDGTPPAHPRHRNRCG